MASDGKEKTQQRIVLVLLAVFVVALTSSLRSTGILGRKSGVTPAATAPATTTSSPADEQPQAEPRAPDIVVAVAADEAAPLPAVEYTADVSRDPLRPAFLALGVSEPVEPQEQMAESGSASRLLPPPRRAIGLPAVAIEGIIWGGRNPQAIVNGRVHTIGDMIGRGRIVAIDRKGLTVEMMGETFRASRRDGSYRSDESGGWEAVQLSPRPD